MAFDANFEINVSLRLSEAAYDVANGVPPKLPDGYSRVADIVADRQRLEFHISAAMPSQQKLFRAMLMEAQQSNVFGLIAKNGNTVAVAFRGTLKPDEWLKDFDFIHVPYQAVPSFGEVHQGFQFIYDSVQASVRDGLSKCDGRNQTLITGHSLGAALTILCAPDLAINSASGAAPEVHNFAGPRVAAPDAIPLKSTFAERFNQTIATCFHIMNRWDIVPNLPPAVALYQHVGSGVGVDGGFTTDLVRAHSLELSYLPGLQRLIPQAAHPLHVAASA